jgi:hypothetical protein
MFGYLEDSPEYDLRKKTPFKPPNVSTLYLFHPPKNMVSALYRTQVTFTELRASIPKHLYEKSTAKGLFYFARDIICAFAVYKLGTFIDPSAETAVNYGLPPTAVRFAKWAAWAFYFHAQGVIFAGLWCLGHEAGHGTLSPHNSINHALGFVLHTVCFSGNALQLCTHEFLVPANPLLFLAIYSSCAPCMCFVHFPLIPVVIISVREQRCPWNVTRTMFRVHAQTTSSHPCPRPTSPTTTKSSRKLLFTRLCGCFSCRRSGCNSIWHETHSDRPCIPRERMSAVSLLLAPV